MLPKHCDETSCDPGNIKKVRVERVVAQEVDAFFPKKFAFAHIACP